MIAICTIPMYANAQEQQSLVTDAMARKVAYSAKYGMESVRIHVYDDICKGNNTRYSAYEYDKLLDDIVNNKDKVENFICYVCKDWGIEDMGYSYFKAMGFTVAEFDIAVKLYKQWLKKEKIRKVEEEKQKKIQQTKNDLDTLASWKQNGKTVFDIHYYDDGVIAPTFIFDIEGYGSVPVIDHEMQTIKRDGKGVSGAVMYSEDLRWQYNTWRKRTLQVANKTYQFIVDGDNQASNDTYIDYEWRVNAEKTTEDSVYLEIDSIHYVWYVRLDSTDALLDHINIQIYRPSGFYFKGIDSTVIAPTRNTLKVRETRNTIEWHNPAYNEEFVSFEIVVEKDKKNNQWTIKHSDENKLRKWFDGMTTPNPKTFDNRDIKWFLGVDNVEDFIGMLTVQLNNQLENNQGKRCELKIKLIGSGERFYRLNYYDVEETTWLPFEARIENIKTK